LHVLEESQWVIAGSEGAATRLGLPPSTLRSKMKQLGIARQQQ
jgi:formate hydrogenlyase transcriptional activator